MAYHHGSLRQTLLAAAAEALAEAGPAALSLRDLARRAGVSHAAPAHHFGDKAGLLTAVAAQGFGLLADALHAARDGGFLDAGIAYVRFATTHRAHFEVMFQPALYRADDPEVVAARARATAELRAGAAELTPGTKQADHAADHAAGLAGNAGHAGAPGSDGDVRTVGLAAWSLAHGFAALWLSGAMPADLGDDPAVPARTVLATLSR
jgi:AcrR family transcriptional regulator